jgi:hypothetical protein
VDTTGLYRGPFEEFVARRTALARELRRTDPEAAAAVSKLRKPPAGVWAIDQLGAENASLVAELLAAGADARDAQSNVAAGSATREDLLEAGGRLRDAVEAATRAAMALLDHEGHGSGPETGRRIRTTLQGAATGSAAARQALWAGTLSADLDVAAFGAIPESEPDSAELAAVVAPRRRESSSAPRLEAEGRAPKIVDLVAQRAAERSAAHQIAAAKRAREGAVAARNEADRLAEEGRRAAEKASILERNADAAEEASREARAALED